jgi:hypothetical protein
MLRWKSLALGAAVFAAAHLAQAALWRAWFQPGGDFSPWFLNSGRAVAFTAGWLFAAGVVVGITTRGELRESILAGGNLGAGAAMAMSIALAVIGPGTIFPIALAIGAGIALFCSVAGALVGFVMSKAVCHP